MCVRMCTTQRCWHTYIHRNKLNDLYRSLLWHWNSAGHVTQQRIQNDRDLSNFEQCQQAFRIRCYLRRFVQLSCQQGPALVYIWLCFKCLTLYCLIKLWFEHTYCKAKFDKIYMSHSKAWISWPSPIFVYCIPFYGVESIKRRVRR